MSPLLTSRKKRTNFDLENLKWGSNSVAEAQLFGSSYLKALILSTVIDPKTLAQVVCMSDCFPAFMHFGKVFPVEEINKFQDDISFSIQENTKEKKTFWVIFSH